MIDSLKVIHPVEEAFSAGILNLPCTPPPMQETASGCLLADILAAGSLLVTILLLKKIVNVFPAMMACVLRWKESVNLEASVKLSRDRTLIAISMIVPFCLIVERFDLYSPRFLSGLDSCSRIAVIIAIFIAYLALKAFSAFISKPGKLALKNYRTACMSFATFFVLIVYVLLSVGGIAGLFELENGPVKCSMLWISIAFYFIYIIRVFQIFISSYSIFAAFLYLCALELIPTGLLVVLAFVF